MKVLQYPLAKITMGFLSGILFAFYWQADIYLVFGTLLLLLMVAAILFFGAGNIKKSKLFFSLLTYAISFLTGMSSLIIQTEAFRKDNYSNLKSVFEKESKINLVIREKLKSSPYHQRYIAVIQAIDRKKYNGRILLNLPKETIPNPFRVGTIMEIEGHLQKNRKPDNPMQFDYSNYLNKKQIYAQLYSTPEHLKIGIHLQKDIWFYIAQIRTGIISNLEHSAFNTNALAVASALILGQRQELSSEIIQDYQYAGAIHILSVSGLHVGFIFLFLNFILKPIPNHRKGSTIKLTIVLTSLFLFALLAGLSPSIVRSVTMFSFMAIGLYLRRGVNIFHTLLVSMLIILLFEPYFLFDVGFQLSYLAVFFIVWFQPVLASFWKPENKITKYFWDILSVSIAAQLGTLPLSLYYFHQFPGLFFVTNLIVIPLLSLIMFVGIMVMFLAALGLTPFWLLKAFEWSILSLNKIINGIASLENFIIKDIPFNFYLVISSYLLICAIIIWLTKPHFKRLLILLSAILFFQLMLLFNHWQIQNQNEWIVLNAKRKTILVERHGQEVFLYSNDSLIKNHKLLKNYLTGNFSHLVKQQKLRHTAYFKGAKILILDSLGFFPKNCKPDIILLTQTPKINIDRMLRTLKPKLLIADGSNYKSVLKHWESSCRKQNIPFHATAEKGYFQLK